MNVTIKPSLARGTVCAPPSKSAAHRAMIAAALSDGCIVAGLGESADIRATRECLVRLGAAVRQTEGGEHFGALDPRAIPECTIDCGESGSTLRFLLPLCLIGGRRITLRGHGRLLQRPLTEYAELCAQRGFTFELAEDRLTVCGRLCGGEFRIDGTRSSQFVTGLLFALPLLQEDSTLIIEGAAQSLSYVAMTEQILREFGIRFTKENNVYHIPAAQHYRAERITVEGDWSNAAFLYALNELGGTAQITGLRVDSVQGDSVCLPYFAKLGREPLELSDCPDLAPVLFALAALRGGRFTGCKRLRLKESDRIAAMQRELAKCGITLSDSEDTVSISPEGLHPPSAPIDGHNDHRIVMAMAVLMTKLGGTIRGAEAVSKSWPDFFEVMGGLGIEVKYE